MIGIVDIAIISSTISGVLCGVAVYFFSKKVLRANARIILEQAQAKAKAIEFEANAKLQESQIRIKEQGLEFKRQWDEKQCALQKQNEDLLRSIKKDKKDLEDRKHEIHQLKTKLLNQENEKDKLIISYKERHEELITELSSYTQLTQEEAKNLLLNRLEETLDIQKARLIKRYEHEALEDARKRANYIIAQATTRYAGEFATERLVNVVHLPNDEIKGKIIGKEGRNIRAFEMISGVDVIIDDTPEIIMLSNFNLYRRATAVKTMELLIEDGRIQPAIIEEIYTRVSRDMEKQVMEDGQKVVLELGLHDIHPELIKLIGKLKYRASFGQNALGHSIEVAKLARLMASELGGDSQIACRAGLLHDIGKVLTQENAGSHVSLGAEICKRYNEPPIVINAILSHHGDVESTSIEASVVCAADAISAGRPGARKEVLENFLNRMQDIEKIALEKFGVQQAYAISAGREVRVIARADLVDDHGANVLAYEIARDIEKNLQYPGEIKVNVIRETRSIEFAK